MLSNKQLVRVTHSWELDVLLAKSCNGNLVSLDGCLRVAEHVLVLPVQQALQTVDPVLDVHVVLYRAG